MAKEETKDFNAMLHRDTDMPKIQIITDPAVIQKYGISHRPLCMTKSCGPCRGASC